MIMNLDLAAKNVNESFPLKILREVS